MEEWAGVGRLDQRWGVERAIAEATLAINVGSLPEASVTREETNDPGRVIGNVLDARVEIRVAGYHWRAGIFAAGNLRRGTGVAVAEVALFLTEEEILTLLHQRALEIQRAQILIRRATQGELERLQGIQLVLGWQAKVHALHRSEERRVG